MAEQVQVRSEQKSLHWASLAVALPVAAALKLALVLAGASAPVFNLPGQTSGTLDDWQTVDQFADPFDGAAGPYRPPQY